MLQFNTRQAELHESHILVKETLIHTYPPTKKKKTKKTKKHFKALKDFETSFKFLISQNVSE